MVETFNKYITCYVKNGKVVEQYFLDLPEEVKTMEAVGRAKGYKTETYVVGYEYLTEKVESNMPPTEQFQEQKRPWNKWIKCVETGEVFPTVRECSNQIVGQRDRYV